MRTISEQIARHEARMARMDRHILALNEFLAADCTDEIEDHQDSAERALARGDLGEHRWHLKRIDELNATLARARQPLPPRQPLLYPVLPEDPAR